ncbi:MAG: FmdE family protein [Nitritalea sp.]
MKNISLFLFFFLLISPLFAQNHHVKSAGAMHEMGKTGFAPAISLDTLKKYPRIIGLGPLGKMQGEISYVDGKPLFGMVNENGEAIVQEKWEIEAPFFVYAQVEEWESFPLEGAVKTLLDLDAFIEGTAKKHGYDTEKPLFFKIEGQFDHMVTHIVTPRSPEIPGYVAGRNQENYTHKRERGQIIGVFSKEGRGIYTHKNTDIHAHFIDETTTFTGHIDALTTDLSTSILYLPKRKNSLSFQTNDTDFSKGRLGNLQQLGLDDLVKFHGHLCDGLVVGALGLQEAFQHLFPDGVIDRTDLRIVSKSSPCLTDAAIYLTGARYQYNTFYVDDSIESLYVVERVSEQKAVTVNLNAGVKPAEIGALSAKAEKRELSACQLDELRAIEDRFMAYLMDTDTNILFRIQPHPEFVWEPLLRNDFVKTDILNKNAESCN